MRSVSSQIQGLIQWALSRAVRLYHLENVAQGAVKRFQVLAVKRYHRCWDGTMLIASMGALEGALLTGE